jgi:hypothetical protein
VREQQNLFNATEVLIEDKASGTQLITAAARAKITVTAIHGGTSFSTLRRYSVDHTIRASKWQTFFDDHLGIMQGWRGDRSHSILHGLRGQSQNVIHLDMKGLDRVSGVVPRSRQFAGLWPRYRSWRAGLRQCRGVPSPVLYGSTCVLVEDIEKNELGDAAKRWNVWTWSILRMLCRRHRLTVGGEAKRHQ